MMHPMAAEEEAMTEQMIEQLTIRPATLADEWAVQQLFGALHAFNTTLDPRFALAYLAVVMMGCLFVLRRLAGRPGVPRIALAFGLFATVSFVAWEVQFSILRYAIGLEALTGIIVVLGIRMLLRRDLAGRVEAAAAARGSRRPAR